MSSIKRSTAFDRCIHIMLFVTNAKAPVQAQQIHNDVMPDTTKRTVIRYLNDLISSGYLTKPKPYQYAPTTKAIELFR